MSATMATLVSRTEKTASAEATLMSQAEMRSTPPPMQAPWTAAMTGTGQSATDVIDAWSRRITVRADLALPAIDSGAVPAAGTTPSEPSDVRSSPTQKWGPLPAMTTARTSGSAATAAMATGRSVQKAGPMALRFSGRSSHRVATWPSTSRVRTSEANPGASTPVSGRSSVMASA